MKYMCILVKLKKRLHHFSLNLMFKSESNIAHAAKLFLRVLPLTLSAGGGLAACLNHFSKKKKSVHM